MAAPNIKAAQPPSLPSHVPLRELAAGRWRLHPDNRAPITELLRSPAGAAKLAADASGALLGPRTRTSALRPGALLERRVHEITGEGRGSPGAALRRIYPARSANLYVCVAPTDPAALAQAAAGAADPVAAATALRTGACRAVPPERTLEPADVAALPQPLVYTSMGDCMAECWEVALQPPPPPAAEAVPHFPADPTGWPAPPTVPAGTPPFSWPPQEAGGAWLAFMDALLAAQKTPDGAGAFTMPDPASIRCNDAALTAPRRGDVPLGPYTLRPFQASTLFQLHPATPIRRGVAVQDVGAGKSLQIAGAMSAQLEAWAATPKGVELLAAAPPGSKRRPWIGGSNAAGHSNVGGGPPRLILLAPNKDVAAGTVRAATQVPGWLGERLRGLAPEGWRVGEEPTPAMVAEFERFIGVMPYDKASVRLPFGPDFSRRRVPQAALAKLRENRTGTVPDARALDPAWQPPLPRALTAGDGDAGGAAMVANPNYHRRRLLEKLWDKAGASSGEEDVAALRDYNDPAGRAGNMFDNAVVFMDEVQSLIEEPRGRTAVEQRGPERIRVALEQSVNCTFFGFTGTAILHAPADLLDLLNVLRAGRWTEGFFRPGRLPVAAAPRDPVYTAPLLGPLPPLPRPADPTTALPPPLLTAAGPYLLSVVSLRLDTADFAVLDPGAYADVAPHILKVPLAPAVAGSAGVAWATALAAASSPGASLTALAAAGKRKGSAWRRTMAAVAALGDPGAGFKDPGAAADARQVAVEAVLSVSEALEGRVFEGRRRHGAGLAGGTGKSGGTGAAQPPPPLPVRVARCFAVACPRAPTHPHAPHTRPLCVHRSWNAAAWRRHWRA